MKARKLRLPIVLSQQSADAEPWPHVTVIPFVLGGRAAVYVPRHQWEQAGKPRSITVRIKL